MPLRAAIPKTVKKPTSEPSERTPPPANAASAPPTSAIGRVRKASVASRQLPNAACKQQEDRERAAAAEEEQRSLRSLTLRELSQHLCVVPEREAAVLEALVDVVRDRAEVAPTHVGADVEAPRDVLAFDDVRSRRDAGRRPRRSGEPAVPRGVSIGSAAMLVRLLRVSGVLQTWTS